MALFPGVLVSLVQSAGSSAIGGDWSTMLCHPHFTENCPPSSASLRFLEEIFVKRNVFLWKQPDVMGWMYVNAQQLIANIEQEDIADLITVSRDQFPASSKNQYSHLSFTEFTDTVEFIPDDEEDPGPHMGAPPAEPQLYHPDPDASVAAAFLESMLPWHHAPTEQGANTAEENAEIDAWFDDDDP
eukprot:TRINITY_DN13021_c0_g1_i4.p2 TRINITY_DN13021_c0_g1~~TRINITY_DN13021_c0_g1_i4.p2  ORF type:complete len:186 (-),score=53.84 TRINITY_DN13021_c0_g1_i4:138-695(-)